METSRGRPITALARVTGPPTTSTSMQTKSTRPVSTGVVAAPGGPHQLGPAAEQEDDRGEQQRAEIAEDDQGHQPPGEDAQPDAGDRRDAEVEGVGGRVDGLAELGHRAEAAGHPAVDGVEHPDRAAGEDPEEEAEPVGERPAGAEEEGRAEPGPERREPVGHPVEIHRGAVRRDQHGRPAGHDQGHHQPAGQGEQPGDDPRRRRGARATVEAEGLAGDQPDREPAHERAAQSGAPAEPLANSVRTPARPDRSGGDRDGSRYWTTRQVMVLNTPSAACTFSTISLPMPAMSADSTSAMTSYSPVIASALTIPC